MIDLFFIDAIEKAKKDPDVMKLMKEGYFLGSVFATCQESIKEWILHFYSSKKNKVIDCTIGEEIIIGEEEDPLKKPNELILDNVKVTGEAALETAKGKYKSGTANILLTLHEKDGKMVWTVNMISIAMVAKTYEIDAVSGEILEEKETNLVTRYSRAS